MSATNREITIRVGQRWRYVGGVFKDGKPRWVIINPDNTLTWSSGTTCGYEEGIFKDGNFILSEESVVDSILTKYGYEV